MEDLLHAAVEQGDLAGANKALQGEADVNVKDWYGNTAMMKAAESGGLDVVRYLVEERGADVNIKDWYGNTAMIKAARTGKWDVVRYLVERGADVNVKMNDGDTAMMYAARGGNWNVVRYLVERGADVNVKNNDRETVMLYAAKRGKWDVVRYLVEERGADVNVKDYNGETVMMLAAENGELGVVRYLVEERGADVNVKDKYGETAMIKAVSRGKLDVVRYLLERGADVNVKMNDGDTAMMYAARGGNWNVVRYLVERGADVNVKNNDRETVMLYAAKRGKWDVVRYLVEERGADVNVKDYNGETVMMLAAENGELGVVRYLVEERGVDVNVKSNNGNTALMEAAQWGKWDVVRYLVEERGADVNVKDYQGKTVMMKAAEGGELDVVRYLVEERGADVNAKDNVGRTAMLNAAAAQWGNWDVVRYLVEERGVDISVKDNDGDTAMILAARIGKWDVVRYLVEERGADVNVKNNDREIVMLYAAKWGKWDVVRYLVEERGADVNVKDYQGKTVMMKAAKSGKLNVVRYLVEERGADVNIKDNVGKTVMMLAAYRGKLDVVRYLVEERGVDVNVKDNDGNTVLMVAAYRGSLDVVRYLVEERGAVVNVKDNNGNTAMMKAAESENLDVMRYLVEERGADVNVKNNDGKTAMILAAKWGNWAVVRYLVEGIGVDVNVKDNDGKTAMMWAAGRSGNLNVVRYLVERGADVNVKDNDGNTAMMNVAAAQWGKWDVVRYLVEEGGADVNVKDKYGKTAMILAAESGKLSVLSYLVKERGMNVNVKDNDGNTAIMWAAESGDLDVVQFLVKRGADVDIQNTKNETALYRATKKGHIAIRNFLLRHVSSSEGVVNVQSSVESLKSYLTSRSWAISPFDIEPVEYNNIKTIGGEYRAKWLDADVVLKLFIPGVSISTFEDEVTTWHQLRHPNVIKLYGACDIGHSFFVLEHASNGTVVEYLAACEKKWERLAPWKLLHQASLGLAYLHERGIIHGNLRSSNVLVGSDGVAKLSDFGLSMSSRDGSEEVVSSRAGFGSARWQAPEQVKGGRVSSAGDIYSFGLCIVEAVTRHEPWGGYFGGNKLEWDPATELDSRDGPADLDENTTLLTSRMCAKDPKQRVTAAAVIRLLEKLAAKEPSNLRSPYQGDGIMSNVDEYKDGKLTQLLATIRNQISSQHSQYEFVLHEVEEVQKQLAQETRSVMLLEAYHSLLVDLDGVLQSGSLGNRVVALSSSRAAGSNLTVFRRRINELWMLLDASRVVDEEREQHWDIQRKKQIELFVSDVSQTVAVLSELDDEEEQTTLMTLLKLELDSHASKYTERQFEVIKKAYDDCCQGKWKSVVTTAPAWYLPWHELVINRGEKLGEGGFGDVYQAKWLDSEVVVKEVKKIASTNKDSFASTWSQSVLQSEPKTEVKAPTDNVDFQKKREERRKLFEQEVNIWFGLSHPHVIRLFGACHVGTPFFACEFASGGSLDKYLRKHPEDIWPKLFEAALGVQYLHSRGIIHGDLKCNNIMIGNDGKAKVTDFGLSSFEEGSEAKVSDAWQWVAPECIESGASKLSVASDVYSLGMCIVEALRVVEDDDRPPYPWENCLNAVVKRFVVTEKKLPLRPQLCTDEQWQLVQRMCAHNPDKRIKISTVVDELAILARGNVPSVDEEVEPEPSKDITAIKDLSKVIAEMKDMCRQFYESATSRNGKILCQIYALLWERLADRTDDTEFLGSLIKQARKSTLALQEEKNIVFAFTEAALQGYALHRNLDKVIEAQMWAADKLDWREQCWKLLASQAISRCD